MPVNKSDKTAIEPISKAHFKTLKELLQKKHRLEEGRTLVEGLNLIEQLLANGLMPREVITSNSAVLPKEVFAHKVKIYSAKETELQALSETKNPQSLIAVYDIPVFEIDNYDAVLYLDGIQDPGNLGTIFRTAAAFGFNAIILSRGCSEVFSPKVIRASLGSVFWIPSMTADTDWLQQQKAVKLGLDASSKKRINELNKEIKKPVVLVIGSESQGLNPEVKEALDYCVSIPMSNEMESLNAAVATGIAAYYVAQKVFLLT